MFTVSVSPTAVSQVVSLGREHRFEVAVKLLSGTVAGSDCEVVDGERHGKRLNSRRKEHGHSVCILFVPFARALWR